MFPSHDPGAGSFAAIDEFAVYVSNNNSFQDIVVYGDVLGSSQREKISYFGNWINIENLQNSITSEIIDWYKFGYASDWIDLGVAIDGDFSDIGFPQYILSSTGSLNHLTASIGANFELRTGIAPLISAHKGNVQISNDLSSSLASSFPNYTVTKASMGPTTFRFDIQKNTVGLISSIVTVNQTSPLSYFEAVATVGSDPIFETGYVNTTAIATESVTRTIISSRFSAPGSIDTLRS